MFKKLIKDSKILNSKNELVEYFFSDKKNISVLDVGFFGQGITYKNGNWLHDKIKSEVKYILGIDINTKISELDSDKYFYELKNAENFDYGKSFDIIFAGDLIEHLSNPGLFLESCNKSIKEDGVIIISTPNAFNLFNIIEKIFKLEPTVNSEHTCYYNIKTFNELISRYGLEISEVLFLKYLGVNYKESIFKKVQNIIYNIISIFTPKFLETIVFSIKVKKVS